MRGGGGVIMFTLGVPFCSHVSPDNRTYSLGFFSGYWVGFILGVVCSKKTLFLFRLAMEKKFDYIYVFGR